MEDVVQIKKNISGFSPILSIEKSDLMRAFPSLPTSLQVKHTCKQTMYMYDIFVYDTFVSDTCLFVSCLYIFSTICKKSFDVYF